VPARIVKMKALPASTPAVTSIFTVEDGRSLLPANADVSDSSLPDGVKRRDAKGQPRPLQLTVISAAAGSEYTLRKMNSVALTVNEAE
jgi:hypothetical protein